MQVGEEGRTRTFIGIVRVTTPEAQGDVSAIEVSTAGLGFDRSGFFLGWQSGNWVEADPAKCQMLVIIRSAAQAEHAASVINSLKGEELCVADYTGQLARAR